MSFLGIDVGTSGCKAVVLRGDGLPLAAAERSYGPLLRGNGLLELDPEAVWTAIVEATRQVTSVASADPPVALSIAAIGEAFVVTGPRGDPLTKIILSGDQRGVASLVDIERRLGGNRIREITGLDPRPHYSAAKIRWALRQGLGVKGGRVALIQDFVASRLGMPAVTDPSLATRTMLWDRRTDAWSSDMLHSVGLRLEQLPEVVKSGTQIALINRRGRSAFGLNEPCAYVVGGLDAACTAMGVGALDPGSRVLSLGTVGSVVAVVESHASGGDVPTGPHVVPGLWIAIGAAQAAGAALRWYRDLLVGAVDADRGKSELTFEALLHEVGDGLSDAIFVPHLSGSRFAFEDSALLASVTGLSLGTRRRDLTRAILEGVALEIAVACERFEAQQIRISALIGAGGGTRSRKWVQIISDATGRPIASTASGDGTAVGAALVAGVGVKAFESFGAASAAKLKVVDHMSPRPETEPQWAERRGNYARIVRSLADFAGAKRPSAAMLTTVRMSSEGPEA